MSKSRNRKWYDNDDYEDDNYYRKADTMAARREAKMKKSRRRDIAFDPREQREDYD